MWIYSNVNLMLWEWFCGTNVSTLGMNRNVDRLNVLIKGMIHIFQPSENACNESPYKMLCEHVLSSINEVILK